MADDSPMDALRAQGTRRCGRTRPDFPLDETPISEGGMWLNGRTDGIDWCDVVTKGGVAFGEVTRMGVAERRAEQGNLDGRGRGPGRRLRRSDRRARRRRGAGTSSCRARVFSRNQTNQYFQEVELRLRSTITPHSCTGYEVFWRCLKTEEAYAEIVRWDGKIGGWKSLTRKAGPGVRRQGRRRRRGDASSATTSGATSTASR